MKKINTSISRCLKSDFKVFEKLGDNLYMLAWGKQDEVERVSVRNEETGEVTYTGEVLDTDWCSYESGVYRGVLTPYLLEENVLSVAGRVPSVEEMKMLYDALGVSEESQLPLLRAKLIEAINRHDKSKDVEDFTIGGVHLWLDSTMRGKVRENLETCQQLGEENTVLRFEGMAFPVTVQMGWQMYYAVLAYARACWNVTESHIASTEKLASVDEILAYDFKAGYPEKPAF